MTPSEWDRVVTKIHDLWGASAKWTSARTAVYEYARSLDYQATLATITAQFEADRPTAPSPSEIISKTRDSGGVVREAVGSCTHPNYAIFDYHADGSARAGMCPACFHAFDWPAGQVRSIGDLDQQRRTRAGGTPDATDLAEAEQTRLIAP